jgi:hypothetical protein
MARPKRTSKDLQRAEQREAGLRSIDENLDLGNGLTLKAYSKKIQDLRAKIALNNTTVTTLDDLSRQIKQKEKALRQLSEKMLLATGAKFGTDSREYGQAGGTPRSERRRPVRKKRPANPNETVDQNNQLPVSEEMERSQLPKVANAEIPVVTNGKTYSTNGHPYLTTSTGV